MSNKIKRSLCIHDYVIRKCLWSYQKDKYSPIEIGCKKVCRKCGKAKYGVMKFSGDFSRISEILIDN